MRTGDGKIGLVEQAVIDKIADPGGAGRWIVIDKEGNIALPFKTAGMYRGHADSEGIAF
jgi:L-asparaginase / beta-aspartyl-peptidase